MQFGGIKQNKSKAVQEIMDASKKLDKTIDGVNVSDIKIMRVKEFDLKDKSRAYVVYVSSICLPLCQKSFKLTRELENQLKGVHVYFVGNREVQYMKAKTFRPYTKTVKYIREKLFSDLVFPSFQTGKRIEHKLNADPLTKFYIDKANKSDVQDRVKQITEIYKTLTKTETEINFCE